MVDDGRLAGEEDNFTRWDETIFERCLGAGFNPFGSGPTPIFLRDRDHTQRRDKHRPHKDRENARP